MAEISQRLQVCKTAFIFLHMAEGVGISVAQKATEDVFASALRCVWEMPLRIQPEILHSDALKLSGMSEPREIAHPPEAGPR